MSPYLENFLLSVTDRVFAALPQRTPSQSQLADCRLVSHRGERDNESVFENTFAAFDPVAEAGIWGIELDIRWTLDLVPVVIHDTNALRVFKKDFCIAEHSWEDCQIALPDVPSLEQLIERYGKRCHLMIELKDEHYPKADEQKQTLQKLLAQLEPCQDFHIIALDTQLFRYVDFLPSSALLPVSTVNAQALSQLSLEHAWGGLTGHYLFISPALVQKHKQAKQQTGSGFSNSKRVLFREINKNIDWVFTNQALKMHKIIQASLKKPKVRK